MTTPGHKVCTLCGEEIVIDAVLCRHCGQIPGLSSGAPPVPRRARRVRAITAGLSFASMVAGIAGFGWGNAALMFAGVFGITVGIALLLLDRSRSRGR